MLQPIQEVCVSLSVCLSVCLSICLSVSACLSVCLSAFVSILRLPNFLYYMYDFCLFLLVELSIVCLSVCVCLSLSVNTVHLSISLWYDKLFISSS